MFSDHKKQSNKKKGLIYREIKQNKATQFDIFVIRFMHNYFARDLCRMQILRYQDRQIENGKIDRSRDRQKIKKIL